MISSFPSPFKSARSPIKRALLNVAEVTGEATSTSVFQFSDALFILSKVGTKESVDTPDNLVVLLITRIGACCAPIGTVTRIWVALACTICPCTDPNQTELSEADAPKFVPVNVITSVAFATIGLIVEMTGLPSFLFRTSVYIFSVTPSCATTLISNIFEEPTSKSKEAVY